MSGSGFAGLFGGQFGGVSFPKVPNPLEGIVITKAPKADPVIWGASPWPRVTKTPGAFTSPVTKTPAVTKTTGESVVPPVSSSRKLKHPGGRPRLPVTKTPAERAAAYRARSTRLREFR